MRGVGIDVRMWPIAVIYVRDGATIEDLEEMIARYDHEVYGRDASYVSVTDLSGLTRPPGAKERARLAEWMKATKAQMEKHGRANSNVMRSALARGAITALYWLFRPPVPQATHGTIEEAMQWARETAIAEGLDDPGDVQDWLQSYDRSA